MKGPVKIVSTRCTHDDEVEKLLNGFIENGWDITKYFIQIVHNPFGTITVFYDEILSIYKSLL